MTRSRKKFHRTQILYSQPHLNTKRVSSCISGKSRGNMIQKQKVEGSITIETALILPFFFLAVICILYMMEVMAIRTSIRSGMQYAAKKVAEETYLKPVISISNLENEIVQAIGAERLDRSVVVGGSGGLHCDESRMSLVTGVLEVQVEYAVKLPVPAISSISVPMEESIKAKGWNGYTRAGFYYESDETVYVTETGMVYHKDLSCNYLDLSIRSVPADSVESLRNMSEGKYHACENCAGKGSSGNVYITNYGDCYHQSLQCSGLKRTVYAIPLSEAIGKGACTKCGR